MHANSRYAASAITILIAGLSIWLTVTLLATGAVRANPGILYAAPTTQGSGDCSSWDDACTVQTALALAVSGDEIWVSAGVHYPGATRGSTFLLKEGVVLFGGFAGGESTRDERDWRTNVTVLSGDIDRNDATDAHGVVTSTANLVGSNAYHVVTGGGASNSAVLDGLTITAGQANGADPDNLGGGMLNINSSPTLANVTFSGNLATLGGGLYNRSSSPSLAFVTFSGNWAELSGGGIFNFDHSQAALTEVTFSGNRANTGAGGGMVSNTSDPTLTTVSFSGNSASFGGGGLYTYVSSPTLTGVVFNANEADRDGGGFYSNGGSPFLSSVTFVTNTAQTSGGAIYNYYSSPTFSDLTLSANSATYGGAIYNDHSPAILTDTLLEGNHASYGGGAVYNAFSDPVFVDATFRANSAPEFGGGMTNYYSNPRLTNAVFYTNTSSNYGGGIHNHESSPVLVQVTFSGNTATSFGGGISNVWNCLPVLINVIQWGNSAAEGPEVYNLNDSVPSIAYSDIQGCGGSGAGWNAGCGTDGGGNIDSDPRFVDAVNGNLRLQLGAPAIDAGSNDAVPVGINTDLDGNPRFVDHPSSPDTGNGTPPIVDMGAYEAQAFTLTVNTLGEGTVTWAPVQSFYNYMDSIVLTATADGDWVFSGWSGAIISNANPLTLIITESSTLTATFTLPNRAPEFTSAPELGAAVGLPYAYAITATDADLVLGDRISITAVTLPAWLTLTDHGGGAATLTGAPTSADSGQHPVLLRVTDVEGLTGEQAFTLTVLYRVTLPLVLNATP